MLGKLEGVGKKVFQHLLQTLGVDCQRSTEIGIYLHVEGKSACLRLVAERTCDRLKQAGEGDLLGVDGNGAELDLGQVEDVADEVQKVGAGTVNRARELNLLAV